MSLLSYIAAREHERIYPVNAREEIYISYPLTSPRIVEKVIVESETVGHSPYANQQTLTWWQYDDEQEKYIDTGISVNTDINTLNQMLAETNVSTLINDANYATTEEDEPLTLEEVREILQ